jgi:metal-sulfur cluster biosynthetic enzyme
MIAAADVRAVLNSITDPCSIAAGRPMGLEDMGLVYAVRVGPRVVSVTLGTTDPRCMMAGVFLNEARSRLEPLMAGRKLRIQLEAKKIWTPRRMRRLAP